MRSARACNGGRSDPPGPRFQYLFALLRVADFMTINLTDRLQEPPGKGMMGCAQSSAPNGLGRQLRVLVPLAGEPAAGEINAGRTPAGNSFSSKFRRSRRTVAIRGDSRAASGRIRRRGAAR